MAKKKKDAAKNRSGWGLFFHTVTTTPVWQLILIIAIVLLLSVFWLAIKAAAEFIWGLLGWGLVFIAAAIITVIVQVKRHRLSSFLFQWHRWLGVITFVLAVWGALAFFQLGGAFGLGIIATPDYLGVLRILGLVILGIVLEDPRSCWILLKRFYSWIVKQYRIRQTLKKAVRRESPKPVRRAMPPTAEEKPALPREMAHGLIPPEGEEAEDEMANLQAVAARATRDLRQVARDVWKKYGQSSELVTVDGWKLPPIDILDVTPEVTFSEADNLQRAKLIEESLASYGVDAKVVQINAGPTVTQFGVEPGWDRKYKEVKEKDRDGHIQINMIETSKTRVKVERITSLANDMALALAAPSIRIEAPVPGKSIIGIEVPNTTSDMVSLRGVIETSAFQKQLSRSKMAIALGKGAGGEAVAADLTKMPHLLIAGATGSGKTVCLNAIITCLLMHNNPNDVRFIMVDPKRVELTQYNSLPHLATPVIVDTTRALNSLRWLNQEMDGRYQKLAAAGARHIEGYNKTRRGAEKLPYLVLVIDELADLMMSGPSEVETILCRLAQLARATGIHLVVATQRPSVDVVTGLIKANFPTRISFAVTSQVDSRTILDGAGAEKLLGRGDMLYMPTEAAKPKRLQGCFLSDAEMERLVYFWSSQKPEEPDKLRMETLVATAPTGTIGGYPVDPLMEQAKELARNYANVSTSFLQRKLHIGYPRAARLFDQLIEVLAKEREKADIEGGGPKPPLPPEA
jgi:S-DNA-T family DNA segregation ATPase FtsK/SpoIIIE